MFAASAWRRLLRWRRSAITVVVVPSSRGRVRTVTVPLVRAALVAIACGAIVGASVIWYGTLNVLALRLYVSHTASERALAVLEAENRSLREERDAQNRRLEQLRVKVEGLDSEVRRIKSLASDIAGVVEATGERLQGRQSSLASRGKRTASAGSTPDVGAGQARGAGAEAAVSMASSGGSGGPVSGGADSLAQTEVVETLTATVVREAAALGTRLTDLRSRAEALQHRVNHTPSLWPARGTISSRYGVRRNPLSSRTEFHQGVDIRVAPGMSVYATADGTVSFAGWKGGYGRLLIVEHGYGIETWYGHNSKILVRDGQRVERGQVIARAGNTGSSTGPHLHYEVRRYGKPVDPMDFLP